MGSGLVVTQHNRPISSQHVLSSLAPFLRFFASLCTFILLPAAQISAQRFLRLSLGSAGASQLAEGDREQKEQTKGRRRRRMVGGGRGTERRGLCDRNNESKQDRMRGE